MLLQPSPRSYRLQKTANHRLPRKKLESDDDAQPFDSPFEGNPMHLGWIHDGFLSWNKRREDEEFTPDLRGADLAGKVLQRYDLRGADLRGAHLLNVDFRDADVTGANFTDAIGLNSAALRGAIGDASTSVPNGIELPGRSPSREDASIGQANDGREANESVTAPPSHHEQLQLVRKKVTANKIPIELLGSSILIQLEELREKIRGNNHLEEAIKNDILHFLDRLQQSISSLLGSIPEKPERMSDLEADRALGFIQSFKSTFREEAGSYVSPENLAKAAVPSTLILSCGALGALFGGPVGFGAGSLFGQFISGQLKPASLAQRVEDLLEHQDASQRTRTFE